MTFYSYGTTAELPSTRLVAQVLGSVQGEALGANARKGAQPLGLFSSLAQAALISGRLIGKNVSVAEAAVVFLSKIAAHQNQSSLHVLSAEQVSLLRPANAVRTFSATNDDTAAVGFSRALRSVLAAANGERASIVRLLAKSFNAATASALLVIRASGHSVFAVSGESAAIARGPGLVRGVGATSAAFMVRLVGWRRSATSSQLSFLGPMAPGKWLSVVSTEAVNLARARPLRQSAASPESTLLLRMLAFTRSPSATSPEALQVQRGMSAARGAASAEVAAAIKAGQKAFAVSAASSAGLMHQIGHLAAATSTNLAALVRVIGKLARVAGPNIAAMNPVTAHVGRAYAAAQAQVANAAKGIQKATLAAAEPSGVALKLVQSRVYGASIALIAGARRTTGILRGLGGAEGVGLIYGRSYPSPSLRAAQGQAASFSEVLARVVQLAALQSQLQDITGRPKLLVTHITGAVSAQASTVNKQIGKAFGSSLNAVQSGGRAIGKFIVATSSEAIFLAARAFHFTGLSVQLAQAVATLRGMAMARTTTSPEVTVQIHQRGYFVGAVDAQQTAVQRRVSKLILAAEAQIAAVIKHIGNVILHAQMPNVADVSSPKSAILGAIQSQAAAVKSWYHLFVADWLRQQFVLLPQAGGRAEPPSFGPIDPADQTTFAFNWASRGNPNDPIVSAQVVSVPPGMMFFGPVFVTGSIVEVTVAPFSPPQVPATYALRCTTVFQSGRRSSFTIPVPVRNL